MAGVGDVVPGWGVVALHLKAMNRTTVFRAEKRTDGMNSPKFIPSEPHEERM
jgi:hypothetical protein